MAIHTIEKMLVEDEGEGDAVVCLHGLGGTSNTWTPLMPALAGYRVIRPDLPGSGRSAGALAGEAGATPRMTIEQMAQAVLAICRRLD
ncbi:MAG: alpha/beta fold hydrolase, partial [Comamonadaceae bacterium]